MLTKIRYLIHIFLSNKNGFNDLFDFFSAERITRAQQEIPANFDKLRTLLTHLGESCLFCQQAQNINVDALFLLSHMLILHDRQLIK